MKRNHEKVFHFRNVLVVLFNCVNNFFNLYDMDYSIMVQILNNENYSNEQKAEIIFKSTLPSLQLQVFNLIPKGYENAITCKEIGEKLRIKTKNISSVISVLMEKYPIDSNCINERKFTYYKIE